MRYALALATLLSLLCACNAASAPPVPTTGVQAPAASTPSIPVTTRAAMRSPHVAVPVALSGKVLAVTNGMFTIAGGPGVGDVHVYTTGATYSGLYLRTGTYAQVAGMGSPATSVTASKIYVSAKPPGVVTLSGTVTAIAPGIITVSTGPSYGHMHVYTSSAAFSGLYPKMGDVARVTGVGAPQAWIGAEAIAVTHGSTDVDVPTHVLTADYLGGLNGTHSIAWSAAAPYLTWAETGSTDADAIHAAGMDTMLYVDPNREQIGSQLYTNDEAAYAHDCSGNRVHDVYQGVTQYVTLPSSTTMQNIFKSYVASQAGQAHWDAIFEDDAGALSAYVQYDPFNVMPCGYSDDQWVLAEIALTKVSSVPVVFNGLSGLNGRSPSLSLTMLQSGNAVGGIFEQCYDSPTQTKMDSWLWEVIEDTELTVAGLNKRFDCMGTDATSGEDSTASRLYAYASFLMTYNLSTSVYRTLYGTPSGLHVFPETDLVPTNALVAQPSDVKALKQPGGTYGREYGACYLRGTLVGACAVVVNNDVAAHSFPFSGYGHTGVISGAGVLDGGTFSVQGPAPPSSVPAQSAVIAFP